MPAVPPTPRRGKPKKPTSRGGYTTDRVVPPASWTRCHAYMERKVRFCHGQCVAGRQFCGAHETIDARPRVPCPYDPSHTIYADLVEAHLTKCPKYVELQQQKEQPHYCQDCNKGGFGDFLTATTGPSGEKHSDDSAVQKKKKNLEWAQQVALRVIAVHQEIFTGKSCDVPTQVSLADIQGAIPLLDLGTDEMDAGLDQAVTDMKIKSGGLKHLQQQASFIGHLRRVGALESLYKKPRNHLEQPMEDRTTRAAHPVEETPTTTTKTHHRTILEVGAGRGITGLLVAGVSAVSRPHTQLVLVERDGARGGRADTTARRGIAATTKYNPADDNNDVATTTAYYAFDISNLPCERIKCDLAHVQLNVALKKKPLEEGTSHSCKGSNNTNKDQDELLVVAKHLCGCGTDYALKSLLPLRDDVSTLIMATCCHGACNWHDFVGRDYVRNIMVTNENGNVAGGTRLFEFGDDEFKLLQLWSAGTVKVLDSSGKRAVDQSGPSSSSLQVDDEHGNTVPIPIGLETKVYGVTRIVESLGLACGEQGLGRTCQRIIDYGRREFIKHELRFGNDDAVELIYYVPDSTTPQNAMLIAHRRSK
jgi:tRNA:m4X modification enzyme